METSLNFEEILCAWHCIYFPAEAPPSVPSDGEGLGSHGICLACGEKFRDGEGVRWQRWASNLGLPEVAAMPVEFDQGRATKYRIRSFLGGGEKTLRAERLKAFFHFVELMGEEF